MWSHDLWSNDRGRPDDDDEGPLPMGLLLLTPPLGLVSSSAPMRILNPFDMTPSPEPAAEEAAAAAAAAAGAGRADSPGADALRSELESPCG